MSSQDSVFISDAKKYGSTDLEERGSASVSQKRWPKAYVYMLTMIVCLSGSNLGYDIGCTGGVVDMMSEEMKWSVFQTELFVGVLNFAAAVGALVMGPLADVLGRRRLLTLTAIFTIASLLLISMSNNFTTAMIGRLSLGLAVGAGITVNALYVAEISPMEHRGQLVSFCEISINFGIMLGMIANYAVFDSEHPQGNWRTMLNIGLILPAIVLVCSLAVLPDTPRWLIMKGRTEEALVVLAQISHETDLDQSVHEIEKQIQAEAETAKKGWAPIMHPTPVIRLMLLAGLGLCVAQQVNGSESLVFYTPIILRDAGIKSRDETFALTAVIGAVKMLSILFATTFVDKFGRRPILFVSTIGMGFSSVGMAVTSSFDMFPVASQFIFMSLFIMFFSVGIGPVTWIGVSEVFPISIRAKAMSLGTCLNRIVGGTVATFALTLMSVLTSGGYFGLFAILCFLSTAYLYTFFPETKGRTLEEIEYDFNQLTEENEALR